MVPYARIEAVTCGHHRLSRAIVTCPTHCVERNLVGSVILTALVLTSGDSRTNLYPEVTPVIVGPLVGNSVLVDEVCTLLVVCIVVNLHPKSV